MRKALLLLVAASPVSAYAGTLNRSLPFQFAITGTFNIGAVPQFHPDYGTLDNVDVQTTFNVHADQVVLRNVGAVPATVAFRVSGNVNGGDGSVVVQALNAPVGVPMSFVANINGAGATPVVHPNPTTYTGFGSLPAGVTITASDAPLTANTSVDSVTGRATLGTVRTLYHFTPSHPGDASLDGNVNSQDFS